MDQTPTPTKRGRGRPRGRSARHAGDDATLAKMAAAIHANPRMSVAAAARAAEIHGESDMRRLRAQFKARRAELLAEAARPARVVDRTGGGGGYSYAAEAIAAAVGATGRLGMPASATEEIRAMQTRRDELLALVDPRRDPYSATGQIYRQMELDRRRAHELLAGGTAYERAMRSAATDIMATSVERDAFRFSSPSYYDAAFGPRRPRDY